MKISDEIRRWCDETTPWPTRADARAIADRIDAEMVELPKDADGVPIRVGDTVWGCGSGEEMLVNSMALDRRLGKKWEIRIDFGYLTDTCRCTHERPDSFERIANDIEAAEGWCDGDGEYCTGVSAVEESTLQEWADRIRKLAKKDEEE